MEYAPLTNGAGGKRFTPTCVGIPVHTCWAAQALRFTPTCVEYDNAILDVESGAAVHPHVRGEYFVEGQQRSRSFGSPHDAWGIRPAPAVRHCPERFTPTCVGNTVYCREAAEERFTPTCVGNARSCLARVLHLSSSPTCVGNTGTNHPRRRTNRFTPTCVGNTPDARHVRLVRFPRCVGNTCQQDSIP